MRAVLALAVKDLRLLLRDKAGLFWVIGFPLLMALFFGSIFSTAGHEPTQGMKIAVVDQDNSPASRAFVDKLRTSAAVNVTTLPLDSARLMARQGKMIAYVLLRSGFGETQALTFGPAPDTGGIEVGIDPSRRAEIGYLEGLLNQAYFALLQKQFTDPQAGRRSIPKQLASIAADTNIPADQRAILTGFLSDLDTFYSRIKVDSTHSGEVATMSGPKINVVDVSEKWTGPHSSWEITFPAAILWGLIGCAAAFSVSIVSERTRGTFLRLCLAPISRMQILAGKGLACFLACLADAVLILSLGVLVFGVRLSNPAGLLAAIVAAAFCFVGLTMLLSVLGKTEQSVSGSGMAIMLVMAMVGGGMIPLFVMPKWLLAISNFSLVKWGILALEGAIWRGFSPGEMLLPLAVLLIAGAACFTVGATILTRSRA
jgi:ABC-2 type transport system permease protein